MRPWPRNIEGRRKKDTALLTAVICFPFYEIMFHLRVFSKRYFDFFNSWGVHRPIAPHTYSFAKDHQY